MSGVADLSSDVPEESQLGDGWVIEPRGIGPAARARELWRYRRLLRYFALKAVLRGVKRTILGNWWLLIRPLFPLAVAAIIFGGVLNVSAGPVPYFLFLVVGTSAWDLFQTSVMWATRSLDVNRGLLTRIYVPRLLLPIATVTPALLNFVIYMAILLISAGYYRFAHGTTYLVIRPESLWSVLAVLLTLVLAIGIGLWTAFPALIARDVRFTLGYVLGFWVFLTPVMYPLSQVPERWRGAVMLNPVATYVELFKWGLLGIGGVRPREIGIALGITATVVVTGLWCFGRFDAQAADKA